MFNSKKKAIGFISLIVGMAMIIPNLAFADYYLLQGIGCIENGDCTFVDVSQLISNVINILRNKIAFPLALLMVIYGGALLIFSGGNQKRVTNGQNALKAAFIGLAIVVGFSLILNTVVMMLTGTSSWKTFLNGVASDITINVE